METPNPPKQKRKPGRPRRHYTDEFKAGAVRPELAEGRTVTQVARDLDLTRSALDGWVQQAKADAGKGLPGALTSAEKEEPARLRRENKVLRMEREISKKNGGLLREGERVRFAFIDVEKASWPVKVLCRALKVSTSGFYAWKQRPEALHEVEDRRLGVLVREAHQRSRQTYGSPRVHAELRARGVRVSKKRVARVMRELETRGKSRRRLVRTTESTPRAATAENLLPRDFTTSRPNERWVGT